MNNIINFTPTGTGSVVTKDIPDNVVTYGVLVKLLEMNPKRVLKIIQ